MQNYSNAMKLAFSVDSAVEAVSAKQQSEKKTEKGDIPDVTAKEWFSLGDRVPYDRRTKKILAPNETDGSTDIVNVFHGTSHDVGIDEKSVWMSFLPGWPDGSFGWAKVNQHLGDEDIGPRLFVEYVGHGDSDKPASYPYGTVERADLVEAQWEAEGIKSTFIVGFDYSSIVALELLSRQLDRRDRGITPTTTIKGVLLMNGGLFADAHSHPWFTTPVLKSAMGGLVTSLAQRSKFAFRELMRPVWSKSYNLTDGEINELFDAIGRRNGVYALSKSAGFVDQHKRNSERWDFGRIFHASKGEVSFHIAGSEEDPFEGRQLVAAQQRLGAFGLDVRILLGGHLTTSEHPELIAQLIQEVGPKHGRA